MKHPIPALKGRLLALAESVPGEIALLGVSDLLRWSYGTLGPLHPDRDTFAAERSCFVDHALDILLEDVDSQGGHPAPAEMADLLAAVLFRTSLRLQGETDSPTPEIGNPLAALRAPIATMSAAQLGRELLLPEPVLSSLLDAPPADLQLVPPPLSLQEKLGSLATVRGVLRSMFQRDQSKIEEWLTTPRIHLGGREPREVLMLPGGAGAVEQMVLGAWLGEPT